MVGAKEIVTWSLGLAFIFTGLAAILNRADSGLLIVLAGILVLIPFGGIFGSRLKPLSSPWSKAAAVVLLWVLGVALMPSEGYQLNFDPGEAEPYASKIVYDDANLKKESEPLVADCQGEKECIIDKLYRYVVENYDHRGGSRLFVQTPSETLIAKGGDGEDLAVLLNSLLENQDIKTYLFMAEGHAYSLACGIGPDDLLKYNQGTLTTIASKDLTGYFPLNFLPIKAGVEEGRFFVSFEKEETRILKAGETYYYGGDGYNFNYPVESFDLRYDVSSELPVKLYVVPSRQNYEMMLKGSSLSNYRCEQDGVTKVSGSCENLTAVGGLIIQNDNQNDTTVALDLGFYFYISPPDFLQKISYYSIDGQVCVVLDPTAGKYGFPGYDGDITGVRVVVDTVTKEYWYFK